VERHLGTRLESLTGAASAVAVAGNRTAVESPVRRLRQSFTDLKRVFVVDEVGGSVVSVPPLVEGRRTGVGGQDWFRRAAPPRPKPS